MSRPSADGGELDGRDHDERQSRVAAASASATPSTVS